MRMRHIGALLAVSAALLLGTSSPASAGDVWIYSWHGAYATQATCETERQARIDAEAGQGQPFQISGCGYYADDPAPNESGSPGWYFRFGLFAA